MGGYAIPDTTVDHTAVGPIAAPLAMPTLPVAPPHRFLGFNQIKNIPYPTFWRMFKLRQL